MKSVATWQRIADDMLGELPPRTDDSTRPCPDWFDPAEWSLRLRTAVILEQVSQDGDHVPDLSEFSAEIVGDAVMSDRDYVSGLISVVRDNAFTFDQVKHFGDTVLRNKWAIQKPTERQTLFLLSPHREILFGGAVGGGKSSVLLIGAAQYLDTPGYSALLLRKSFRDLNQPDALIPRSKEWWSGIADWNQQDKRWTFPSGATVTFGYLENDKDVFQYRGAAFHYIGWDELTDQKEFNYKYLFSRQRKQKASTIPLRMRATSNPGGPGHDFVKKRFLKEKHPDRIFIKSMLSDNPHLDQGSAVESLMHLDPITRDQLLKGDWDSYEGGRFKKEWFRRYEVRMPLGPGSLEYHLGPRIVLPDSLRIFMTCDPAATAADTSKKGDDPDWTVACVWGITNDSQVILLDVDRFRAEIPDICPRLRAKYREWKADYIGIEAVASNSAVYQLAKREPMSVVQLTPRGVDKLVRATKGIAFVGAGRLWIPNYAEWLEDFESELLRYTGDEKKDSHDDCVDNVSYMAELVDGSDDTSGEPVIFGKPMPGQAERFRH